MPLPHPFIKVGESSCPNKGLDGIIFVRTYRFVALSKDVRTVGRQMVYYVEAERFSHDVFSLKYYPRPFKEAKFKYQLAANSNDLHRIIATVHEVGLSLLQEFPYASFGFIGLSTAHKEGRTWLTEPTVPSLRYLMYERYARRVPNADDFDHKAWPAANAYIMINKLHPDRLILEDRIMDMFIRLYNDILDPRIGDHTSHADVG